MKGSPRKRRKHFRTRTGCLTCRKRRIKCDEKRPTCAHCDVGPRECNYLPSIEPKEEAIEDLVNTSTNSELIGFPSLSILGSPSIKSMDSSRFDQKLVIESPMSSYSIEPLCTSATLIISGFTLTTYSQALRLQHEPLSFTEIIHSIPQSISSYGTRSKPARFFLQYHQETITEAHYLHWYDHSKLCTVILFALAEISDALQHAMIAFSALIYSIKENHRAREIAFIFYSMALQELRLLLNKPEMDMTDCFVAVATALELSLFDRILGDVVKCSQHLKGAARILQQVTNPVQLCSSVVGRSLFEWFVQFENYCCIIAPFKLLLPRTWREENVRLRHKLAIVEYPHLPESERKARILDDVWPEYWLNIPDLIDMMCNVPKLKSLSTEACSTLTIGLRTNLTSFEEKLERFGNLPYVLEVLEPATYPSSQPSKHIKCCPPPPFIPHTLQFPPAGILRITLLAMRLYIQLYLWPPIYDACGSEIESPKPEETYAIEICRTFAGIEDALGDNPDSCLPIFTALVLVIRTCPQELRLWVWHKLAHFEQLGLATFKHPIRDYYAKLWNIVDIRPEMKIYMSRIG